MLITVKFLLTSDILAIRYAVASDIVDSDVVAVW
jgi:hypothetical protein